MKWTFSLVILHFVNRPILEQQLHHFYMSVASCLVKRRAAKSSVLGIQLCTTFEQALYYVTVRIFISAALSRGPRRTLIFMIFSCRLSIQNISGMLEKALFISVLRMHFASMTAWCQIGEP